jgi:hypothetical protein
MRSSSSQARQSSSPRDRTALSSGASRYVVVMAHSETPADLRFNRGRVLDPAAFGFVELF